MAITPVRDKTDPPPPAAAVPPPAAKPASRPIDRIRRRQFRRDDPREIRHLLSVAIAKMISRLVWLMPVRFRIWLAELGGMAFYRFFRTYLHNVQNNVRQVLGPEATAETVDDVMRSIFRCAGRNFADVLLIPHISPAQMRQHTRLVEGDWASLDAATARGHGVILVTGHLGAFDYLAHVVASRGYPLTSVTGRTTNRYVFDAVTYLRSTNGLHVVEATPSGIRRVIRALHKGECVAFVADYDYFQSGKPVEFFGRRTTLPPGPVRLARDTGAAILPLFAHSSPDGREFSLGEPFYVAKTANLDDDLARGLQQVAAALEPRIRASINQWVLFQAMWPAEDAAAAPAAPPAVDGRESASPAGA